MPLILGTNSIKDTGYDVANSCRFNDGDGAYMHKTPGSTGNQQKYTLSCWLKRSLISSEQKIFSAQYSNLTRYAHIGFNNEPDPDNDKLLIFSGHYSTSATSQAMHIKSVMKFMDTNAWYNIVVAVDTTQATDTNRIKVYVNGTLIELDVTELPEADSIHFFNVDTTAMHVGDIDTGSYFDGYMAEFVWIDGTQYAASDFGEFDSDSPTIWKPKDVSGLTFGTNGFYLDFKDSSNLGNDANGGTDLTEVNLAATDQATDTPTNNFATFNPLHKTGTQAQQPLSEGNCIVTSASSQPLDRIASTIAVTSGKWYAEFKRVDGGGDRMGCGVFHYPIENDSGSTFALGAGRNDEIGRYANMFGVKFGGEYQTDNSSVSFTSLSNGTIMGIFMDLDNHKLYFSKDGTLVSTTGKALTDNGEPYAFMVINEDASSHANFGGCPGFALSSAVADANGYGSFEYDPSQGGASNFDSSAKDFLALCTKNVAEEG